MQEDLVSPLTLLTLVNLTVNYVDMFYCSETDWEDHSRQLQKKLFGVGGC